MMILHYMEVHRYRPPAVFVESLPEFGELVWDERAEQLSAALLDHTLDLETRASGIADLAGWKDRRAMDALVLAMRDAELVDCVGDELGRSLAQFADCEFGRGLRYEDLPPVVRWGMAQG